MSIDITPDEIKRIRGRYGLSQQAFARLLGIGEASMVRYENGQKPTKANANLIRAANHPTFMAECLERDGALIPAAQREKAEQVVYAMVTFDEEGEVMDITDMYMITLEQEILNEKAAGMLAEIASLLAEAESRGDVAAIAVYSDAYTLLSRAKGRITREVDGDKEKLSEIKGAIEGFETMVKFHAAKAA